MNGNLAKNIVQEFFSVKNGSMYIGNASIESIAQEYGTPLYIYDANILRRRYKKVKDAFGSKVSVLFALKCNSNAAVANVFKNEGAGAEVASAGEIEVAKAAGFNGQDLQFAGPGKTELDITRACDFDVYCINAESSGEVKKISTIAKRLGKKVGISIRVQQPSTLKGARMRMSGGDSKFGVPITEVPELCLEISKDPSLVFRGLHLYAGTQCFDADGWFSMTEQLFDLTKNIESSYDINVSHLNFGGGFGFPVFDGDAEFDIDRAGTLLNQLIASDENKERKYFIELGRYLAAPAGMYLTKVVDVKQSGEKQHVILNGGMHHHAAAVGVGSLMKRSFPIVMPGRIDEPADINQCLGGPLCLPADEISSKASLPNAKVDDLVAVLVSGAYGLTFSPVLFLGHPLPGEVLVDGVNTKLVRQPGQPEDILRGQIPPGSGGYE